jgi:hypothetical protein
MMNRDLYRWMRKLADDEHFRTCVELSDRALIEQYDMELVLRFIVFRTMPPAALTNIGDLGEFLTDKAKLLAQDKTFDLKKEEKIFRETFALLESVFGDDAFRRHDKRKDRFSGGFSVSAFEALAIGIGYNPKKAIADPAAVLKKVQKMWEDPNFTENSGSGIGASARVRKIIPYGRTTFAT